MELSHSGIAVYDSNLKRLGLAPSFEIHCDIYNLIKNKQGSDEDHMDRLLRDTKGRSKNKKQARVSFDPQSLHNTHTAS